MASTKAANARNDVLAAERIRQGTLDQEAAGLNTQSQDRYQGFEAQQGVKSKELGDYFAGAGPTAAAAPVAGELVPQSSSNITVQNETKARGKAKGETDNLAAKRGEMRAFGDVLGGIGRLQARDATKIGQIGGFKKASGDVTSLELDAASGAGNGIKTFGDILGGLGTVATGAGLSGMFTGAAGAAGAGNVANSAGGLATARAADRLSMPGYSAASAPGGFFRIFG